MKRFPWLAAYEQIITGKADSSEDWERFRGYARRVRVLEMTWGPGHVDEPVLRWVFQQSDEGPLLPTLRELSIRPLQSLSPVVTTIIPPSISCLVIHPLSSIYRISEEPAHHDAIKYIVQYSPHLARIFASLTSIIRFWGNYCWTCLASAKHCDNCASSILASVSTPNYWGPWLAWNASSN